MTRIIEPRFMEMAIREAEKNLKTLDGGPFGACIVKDGVVLAVARNKVFRTDATSHAEVSAIRLASRRIKTFDLSGCVIYSTTEPCPMCFSAIHWAKIGTIVYGTDIADAKRCGFHELEISNATLKKLGKSKIKIIKDFMRPECVELFNTWTAMSKKLTY